MKEHFKRLILAAYNLGWEECADEDDSNQKLFKKNSILRTAYLMGWDYYIIGDDVTSIDNLTNEEILKRIQDLHKKSNEKK